MDTLVITIPGELRGKGRPRFARRGNHVSTFTDDKTVSMENWVKVCAIGKLGKSAPCADGPLALHMIMQVGIPASWSKKKREQALLGNIRPTGKPDLDNCAKLIADALNGIVWRDDSQIVEWSARKFYADTAQTILNVGSVP